MDFSSRSYNTELLDRDDIPFSDIEQNMLELNIINTWLGGHRITLSGFKKLIGNKKEITVCEIGCGGGDNLLVIRQWCNKKNIAAKLIGIDINADCIKYAKTKLKDEDCAFLEKDYRAANLADEKPGIIFSSLFCHHFNNPELIG